MSLRIGFNARCLVDGQTRGHTRYATNLLRGLSRHSDLQIVLFSDIEPAAEHVRNLHAKVVVVGAKRETLWEAQALPLAIYREKIDIFHAPADRGLPIIKPCPCVVTVHDSFERAHWRSLFATARKKYWYWRNELVNRLLADAIVTVSDTTLNDLVALGVAPASMMHRVYLAPAAEFSPAPLPADADVLRRHNVSTPYVLYVGAYDLRKNVDALVRAFDCSSLGGYALVISARQEEQFRRLAAEWRGLDCFPRLRLIEASVDDLPALYRRATMFVNPSLWESFSFQVVEAFASGTPLIASNHKAIPEIAGDAAMLTSPTDVRELAASMELLASNPELREGLRQKGFARVQGFSWQETTEETLRIYEQLLGRCGTERSGTCTKGGRRLRADAGQR